MLIFITLGDRLPSMDGGTLPQLVERATPDGEVMGSIPAVAKVDNTFEYLLMVVLA